MRLQFKKRWVDRVQNVLLRRGHSRSLATLPVSSAAVTPDWDEAYLRVESYLRAHHIESRMQLSRLTTDIIAAARTLSLQEPTEAPVTLAIRIAQARIGEWLVHALGEGDWKDERFRARGRLALLMSNLPHECPERFLSFDDLPSKMRDRLATAKLEPGPTVRLAGMPPAPLEFSLTGAVEEKWTTFSRSAFFQASASWLFIATIAGVVWLASR